MLIRLIDFLQTEHITVLFTAFTLNTTINEQTDEGVSSLVDAWLLIHCGAALLLQEPGGMYSGMI